MMIAFITLNRRLLFLIEGLLAQIEANSSC